MGEVVRDAMGCPLNATAHNGYTDFHPRWYRQRTSTFWWLGRWPYLKFILRELSSIAVALAVLLTLLQIRALLAGPQAYVRFQQTLRSPVVVLFNVVAFLFVLFHSITWFNLGPRAMAVRVRGRRIPDMLLSAPNYVVWAVVSGIVAWLVLRT
jgi:fumarate reductase subunit C